MNRPIRFNLILFAAGVFTGCGHVQAPPTSPTGVSLFDVDNKPFELWQPTAPATVVLFTRSDCPISNRAAPEVRRLYEKFHPQGVEIYLIYVDPREQADDIRKHLKEYGYPCPALRDPTHSLVAFCKATVTPEAVVFGKDRSITYQGRIDDQYVDVGKPRDAATTHDLENAIELTLRGQSVAIPRTKAVGCLIADLKK